MRSHAALCGAVALAAGCHLALGIDGLEKGEAPATVAAGGSAAQSSSTGVNVGGSGGSGAAGGGVASGGMGPSAGGGVGGMMPPTCNDVMRNGDETDVDCGGSCTPCEDGMACNVFGDCTSGFCNAMTCAPCTDITDCQSRSYCLNPGNSGDCVPQLVLGEMCSRLDECMSGNCVDSVCCDTACAGVCETCFDVTRGICTFAPLGSDPDGECTGGQGHCDGNGSCI